MLTRLLDLFVNDPEEDETVDPALAAAGLMFEVVWADHDVDDDELAQMCDALSTLFALDDARVAEIVAETRRHHDESVGLFHFTRALNEQLNAEEKLQVLTALWHVAYADARLDRFEEHMIRRISELLYVSHTDFITAKLAARDSAPKDSS